MIDYKKAGVDIDKANLFVKKIKPLIKKTKIKEVLSDIGPFAGFFSAKEFKNYKHPVLVSSTDGVGTKIKLCVATQKYSVAGYDLVAMNVNDIITSGARPLFFLDYFATSKLDIFVGTELIKGIIKGCRDSAMSLIGGETAELPGFYKKGEFDLAGFSVGVVDKDKIITGKGIRKGDIIAGFPSSGPHSNGYSLIRKVFSIKEVKNKWGISLLPSTRIYVKDVLSLLHKDVKIKGMAHITGGGFYDNIERILLPNLDAVIEKKSWSTPGVFKEIQRRAEIKDQKMYRTFNMGIGFILIIPENEWKKVSRLNKSSDKKILQIGRIDKGNGKVNIV
ncbi:MAG: phosphoribosylformylglycinamidine cyclo-ligase [Candidatus Saelkia tenebricola]|nr:phosphoribosylformylglycinamidine cyclo-ligase [Candidatus Saelkia tenebricola]